MNIILNLLSTTLSALFIITFKVSSSFFNLVLNNTTLLFQNFSNFYLFVHPFQLKKRSLQCMTLQNVIQLYQAFFDYFRNIYNIYIYIYIYTIYIYIYIQYIYIYCIHLYYTYLYIYFVYNASFFNRINKKLVRKANVVKRKTQMRKTKLLYVAINGFKF